MNVEDDEFFLIYEEITYYKQTSEIYPESILRDFTIRELDEFIIENSQELKEIASEVQEALSYLKI